MKKLILLCAVFGFVAATSAFAQSNPATTAKSENAVDIATPATPASDAAIATPASTPKSCCKAGASKSCCKDKAAAGTAAKSCNHAHADADMSQDEKAARDAGEPATKETPKK